ncbi:hypothetical protein ACFSC4_13475 [Deinococcus malanensis]|uniref:hypothetical protein n=1 Tax=Deinococcus malanensis TaxID=1706855 RepID=UPI003635D4FF
MTDSNVQIRLATPNDKDTVCRVFREAGLDTEAALAEGTTYWVLERGGQPVGSIGLEHGEGSPCCVARRCCPKRGAGDWGAG